jgi:all-trans-8'-apo-beta-carotenal 15,15'-oxygenase
MKTVSRISRRDFVKALGAASALGLIESSSLSRVFAADTSTGYLAHRTAGAEGAWELKRVEGSVPRELNGVLYRVAPGHKETFGVKLQHLFDGDAFASRYTFREGNVSLRARFVDTPQRREEMKAGEMRYSEYGTRKPLSANGPNHFRPKFAPSVNIIRWDGRMLGLSEGGHPTAIDPIDLSYQSEWDFHGTLAPEVSFTAHPRFDPQTGEGYAYGTHRGDKLVLMVYRMERDGRLKQLYALPQKDYSMIHDMLLTREHIILVIPPLRMDIAQMVMGRASVADALVYAEREPTRFVILRKDGTGAPVTIEAPSAFVFHHGNAFEQNGRIVMDSILYPDASTLKVLHAFDREQRPPVPPNVLTRLTLDPIGRAVVSRTEFTTREELPRFDARRVGSDARYLYTISRSVDVPFVGTGMVRHDLHAGSEIRVAAGPARVYGEPVFVPHPGQTAEDRGWVLAQGYDASRDETFLEMRDAGTMDFEARVWTGQHFPLGFHGNFYATDEKGVS